MTLDKALERALQIEAVTRIEEEDNEPRVSAIQSNENTKLVNSTNDLVRTLKTNQPNGQENQKFSSQGARPKEFLRGSERSSRENGDRNRSTNSYTRSSAEHRRNNYESRGRSLTPGGENRSRDQSHESRAKQSKAVLSSRKKNIAVAVSETMHLGNAKIVSNVGAQSLQTKLSVFKQELAGNGRASFSACYVKTLRGGNSPVEALFAKIMMKDKLMMALIDTGSSANTISDSIYKQLGEPSQIRMCNKNIIAASNGKMPIMGSADIQVQLQKYKCEKTVIFLVTRIEITPCFLGMEFLYNFDCILNLRKNELFLRGNWENITLVPISTK